MELSAPFEPQSPDLSQEEKARPNQPKTETLRFSFHGAGGSLFGIQIVNVFLTLLTLGIYHFWAKIRIRKYIFSQTECAGDRFAYHGTGKELLIGFLRAALIFGVPYAILTIGPDLLEMAPWIQATSQWLGWVLVFVFVPVAVISARRYRLSRTSWRGIRFSFRGRTWDFLKLTIKGSLLTALTLGAHYPYFQVRRQAFLTSNTYFGSQSFGFNGDGDALVPSFTTAILLTPVAVVLSQVLPFSALPKDSSWWVLWGFLPLILMALTLGPLWIWFLAKKQRYFWSHTYVGPGRCRSTITGRRLLNLQAENLLLLILTLGFAWPWITVRTTRFYLANLSVDGDIDLERILQDTRYAHPTGEGLANLLDLGFDMD